MKEDYTIDELVNVFEKHLVGYIKQEARLDEKDPNRVKYYDDFCLSAALLSICKHIEKLDKRIKSKD